MQNKPPGSDPASTQPSRAQPGQAQPGRALPGRALPGEAQPGGYPARPTQNQPGYTQNDRQPAPPPPTRPPAWTPPPGMPPARWPSAPPPVPPGRAPLPHSAPPPGSARRRAEQRKAPPPARRGLRTPSGCLGILALLGVIGLCLAMYLFIPLPGNILLMGIDYVEPPSALARTDTLMIATFNPLKPYVGLLSIPRDLWVNIPGYGENRINTAHFFAEAEQPGSGPAATIKTVEENFGVKIHYHLRLRFRGFIDIIDAMDGVEIELSEPMAGYEPGVHYLRGRKALAFVRERLYSDDFYRMERGQIMLKAVYKNLSQPKNWVHIPAVMRAFFNAIDTDLPAWMWPRLGFSLLRTGIDQIDNRTITREMVTPFTTNEGASVLLPNWALIQPGIEEMFGR